jgi:hypothetical protein
MAAPEKDLEGIVGLADRPDNRFPAGLDRGLAGARVNANDLPNEVSRVECYALAGGLATPRVTAEFGRQGRWFRHPGPSQRWKIFAAGSWAS